MNEPDLTTVGRISFGNQSTFTPNINYSDSVRRLIEKAGVSSASGTLTTRGDAPSAAPVLISSGTYIHSPATTDVDTLRQIRILLRCIQQPVVAYDRDLLTMVQSAVGYCGEMAAQIESLLPKHGTLEDGE